MIIRVKSVTRLRPIIFRKLATTFSTVHKQNMFQAKQDDTVVLGVSFYDGR